MVLNVATRTSLITGLPATVTARRTISERFRPRYFGTPKVSGRSFSQTLGVSIVQGKPNAAAGEPNSFLEEKAKLWEIGGSAWLPFSTFESPEYLDGSLPGDRGFDPFSLGASWGNPPEWAKGSPEEARLPWLLVGEQYNGRVAMLAAVGILTVELQGKGPWWEIPSKLDYFGLPYIVGVVAAHVCFAFMEKKRIENWQSVGETGYFFSEGAFDPLGLTSDYNRQAEIRNCRLAMLATLGFAVQAYVTGKGPIENAADHLRDPFGANIFTYERGPLVAGIFTAFSVVMHVAEAARGKSSKKSTRGFAA